MAKFYDSSDIHSLDKRQIFFDANILLYIFWPTGSSWEKQYSAIFKQLLEQKNKMIVDFIVISEVVNRAVRIEYDKHLQANNISRDNLTFKKYRDGSDGQEALNVVYQIVKKMLSVNSTLQAKHLQNLILRIFCALILWIFLIKELQQSARKIVLSF